MGCETITHFRSGQGLDQHQHPAVLRTGDQFQSRRISCIAALATPSASAGPTPERPGGLCKTTCSRRLLQRHLAAQRHLGGRRHGHDVRCSQLPAMCGRVSVLRARDTARADADRVWGLSGVGNPQPGTWLNSNSIRLIGTPRADGAACLLQCSLAARLGARVFEQLF